MEQTTVLIIAMPRITSLEPIKRQKSWYELRLDSGVSFVVNDELILKYSLKTGKNITGDEIKIIRDRAEYLFLQKKALDILARRRISVKEMRRKLKAFRSYAHHTEQVISDLQKHGLIDDYSLAAGLIHSSLAGSPRSKRYIKQKLYQKGVPQEIIDKAMDDELDEYDENEAALRLGMKKYKTVKNLPELKAKKRIADFLRGQGFNWDIINSVLDKLFKAVD